MAPTGGIEEVADGVAFVPSFANVSAFATDDGLVLVDTGSEFTAGHVHEQVRRWSPALHTAVYSHGHIDHVFGVPVFEEEARRRTAGARRASSPTRRCRARFDRYILTGGLQRRHQPAPVPDAEPALADRVPLPRRDLPRRAHLDVGGERFELHHARGETDDHTWTWVPARKVLCCGDLFIWASPNAGNPQKVQRYPREWAVALRAMAGLGAEVLLPGHGVPIVGADRIVQALTDTAELLESLHDQTLAMMNEGARLDDIVHTVRAPAAPARTAVPAPGLRRAGVRRAQHVAPLRRLVRRQPGAPQAGARRRLAAELAALAGGAARSPTGRWSWPPPATSASPAISPSWPRRPRPTTPACTRPGPRSTGAGRSRGLDDVQGRLRGPLQSQGGAGVRRPHGPR